MVALFSLSPCIQSPGYIHQEEIGGKKTTAAECDGKEEKLT
jgi:hypothetical protein